MSVYIYNLSTEEVSLFIQAGRIVTVQTIARYNYFQENDTKQKKWNNITLILKTGEDCNQEIILHTHNKYVVKKMGQEGRNR